GAGALGACLPVQRFRVVRERLCQEVVQRRLFERQWFYVVLHFAKQSGDSPKRDQLRQRHVPLQQRHVQLRQRHFQLQQRHFQLQQRQNLRQEIAFALASSAPPSDIT